MDYHVAIDPELSLPTQDFVDMWNSTPDCRDLAEAEVRHQLPEGFPLDPELVQQGLVLLSAAAGLVGGLALDALKDVVKEKLTDYLKEKLSREPEIQVEAIRQPGGAYLLVVTEDEA